MIEDLQTLEIRVRLDHKNPVYRKIMVPWWDSEIACLILISCMLLMFVFGMVGISVAYKSAEYRTFVWVPALIATLSSVVVFSTAVRLIRRYLTQHRNPQ